MYSVGYRVGKSWIGMGPMPSFSFRGLAGNIPRAITYVCPKCGSGWAQRVVNTEYEFHATCSNLCPQCGPGFLFLRYEASAYIHHAPREVLIRELSLISLLPNPLTY